ncbi:transporter [Reichenbachiella ulvae]|uniref:Transporter n=1 Tax=Reichenbachiella ulvae TaxID=2980104 RepID=A0ABT3CQ60_9BACT|nr:transporter [Reichenbachiella ulvae]MCV9385782.1 transporter [Reichenbachiella ulvae]
MRILITTLFLLTSFSTWACDICGCQLGAYSFGILSQNPSHFIGFRYSQAQFHASIDNEVLADEYSDDTYQMVELMGRYMINSKWYVTASLPYGINKMDGNSQQVSINGIGDPILLSYYNLFNTSSENFRKWNHSLLLGAGLKFPLGEYDAEDQDQIINRNFQLGSGSLDYLVASIYTVKYQNWGLNLEGSYKINSKNNLDYRIGNQFNALAKVYYALIQPEFSLLPYVGMVYEQSAMHTEEGFKQINTGGKVTMGQIGLQAYAGPVMLMGNYNMIVSQYFNTDSRSTITSDNRFQLGLVFNLSLGAKREMDL